MTRLLSTALLVLPIAFAGCIETGVDPIAPDAPAPIREEEEEDTAQPDDPRAPTADAGEDREAGPLTDVFLDGSRSADPQGLELIPTWSLVSIPEGSSARMERADAFEPSFFADVAGVYEAELTVTNALGIRSKHADGVTIYVVPEDALYVQLTWDSDVDLDLHLVPDGDPLWGETDASWCNPEPDWGASSVTADDPSLDWDAIDGFGPETTTLGALPGHAFRVAVDVYGQGGMTTCRNEGCPETVATVQVWREGEPVATFEHTLDEAGQLWHVALVEEDGQVVEDGRLGRTELDDCQ